MRDGLGKLLVPLDESCLFGVILQFAFFLLSLLFVLSSMLCSSSPLCLRFHVYSYRTGREMDKWRQKGDVLHIGPGTGHHLPAVSSKGDAWPLPLSVSKRVAFTSPFTLSPSRPPCQWRRLKASKHILSLSKLSKKERPCFLKNIFGWQIARRGFQIDAR